MPDNQAKMIQMLAALSQMQMSRRSADLEDRRFEEQKAQFATSMGFNKENQQYKQISDIVDAIARSSSEARTSLVELGKSVGLKDNQLEALSHFGTSAPESMQVIKDRGVREGIASLTPGARTQMNQESAIGAMTGMNRGQMDTSAMISMLAGAGQPGAGYPAQMLSSMGQGFLQRAATGQTVDQAAVSQAQAGNPALITQRAGIEAGNVTPFQAEQLPFMKQQADASTAQAQAAQGQVAADFYRTNAQIIANSQELTAKLASAKALGGLTSENYIAAINGMRELVVAGGKEKNAANREKLTGQWNALARLVGLSPIKDIEEAMQNPSFLERINPLSQPGLGGPPPTAAPYQPFQYQQQPLLPFMNTPPAQYLQPGMYNPMQRP